MILQVTIDSADDRALPYTKNLKMWPQLNVAIYVMELSRQSITQRSVV